MVGLPVENGDFHSYVSLPEGTGILSVDLKQQRVQKCFDKNKTTNSNGNGNQFHSNLNCHCQSSSDMLFFPAIIDKHNREPCHCHSVKTKWQHTPPKTIVKINKQLNITPRKIIYIYILGKFIWVTIPIWLWVKIEYPNNWMVNPRLD